MFPEHLVPNNIDGLISTFLGIGALIDFSRAQTLSGAETVVTLAQAHGIEANFNAAFSGVPMDSNGEEVDLEPFHRNAIVLAEKLLAMLEARAKADEEKRALESTSHYLCT